MPHDFECPALDGALQNIADWFVDGRLKLTITTGGAHSGITIVNKIPFKLDQTSYDGVDIELTFTATMSDWNYGSVPGCGVGFIGAGVIFHAIRGDILIGLTTAASIWVTAAIGMAAGAGMYIVASVVAAITLIVLLIPKIQH